MKSRNQAGLNIDLEIEKDLYDRFLPTLTVQIVAENCFKHNKMTATSPLHISIKNVGKDYILIRK